MLSELKKSEAEPDQVAVSKAKPRKRKAKLEPNNRASIEVHSDKSEKRIQSEKGTKRKNMHNKDMGSRGEVAAVSFLERRGIYIRDRNWSCKFGEVDIVAEEEDALIFIEVKTRSSCDYGFPEEAVDGKKRKRYEKIAGCYLKDNDVGDKCIRFDVIAIQVISADRAFLRHHRNAFVTCE